MPPAGGSTTLVGNKPPPCPLGEEAKGLPDCLEVLVEELELDSVVLVEVTEEVVGSANSFFFDPTTPPTTAAMITAITTIAMMIIPFVVA